MGFGYVLGGVAKGLQAADELAQKQTVADAQAARANTQIGIALKNLELKQTQLSDTKDRNLQSQVNKHIADSVKVVTQIIKNGQATGTPPDKLMNAVAPLLDDIDAWGLRIGNDTSKIRLGITNLVKTGGGTAAPKVGSTLENIKAKLSRGEKLNAGEQKLYDDSLHSNAMQALINEALQGQGLGGEGGDTGGDTGGAPAPAVTPPPTPQPAGPASAPVAGPTATPVKTQTIAAPTPPVPPGLANVPGLAWSPSVQKFFTPDGKAYDANGTVVNP